MARVSSHRPQAHELASSGVGRAADGAAASRSRAAGDAARSSSNGGGAGGGQGGGAAQGKDARSTQLPKEAKHQRNVLKSLLAAASDKASSLGSLPSFTGPNSDLEFARKNLRNTYLNLLFSCTFARAAHGVDTSLWVETTHPLVAIYRKHLALLEKAIASLKNKKANGAGAAAGSKKGGAGGGGQGGASTSNPHKAKLNEYTRVASEYRKFLLSEELFWQELASRIVHTFQLHEAKPVLDALDIAYDADTTIHSSGTTAVASSGSGMRRIPGAGSSSITSSAASAAETAAQLQAASIPSNRDRLIEIVHKALICCGDLARYRVRVTDKPAEPHKGKVSSAAPGKTAHDYERAADLYTQARRLLPDNGNPSNQLAVIATMLEDPLGAIHYYYRALCCRVPFDTARQNLDSSLAKHISAFILSLSTSSSLSDTSVARFLRDGVASMDTHFTKCDHRAFFHVWRDEFVALHGFFHRKVFFTLLEPLNQSVIARLSLLVKSRQLSTDTISKVVTTGLSASWTTRLWRHTASADGAGSRHHSSSRRRPEASSSGDRVAGTSQVVALEDAEDDGYNDIYDDELLPESFTSEQRQAVHMSIENQLVAHVLDVIRVLMDVGAQETKSILHAARRDTITGAHGQSARLPPAEQRVTATFKRVLPALRVAIKWVKGHLEYIERCKDRALTSSQSSASDSLANLSFDHAPSRAERRVLLAKSRVDSAAVESIFLFWRSLVEFINTLRYAFPWDDLPALDTLGPLGAPALCLDEDLDMRGFSPTKKAMLPHGSGGMGDACAALGPSQALPNEEQLMRVADLLFDAKVVAESPTSPIAFDDERNAFVYVVPPEKEGHDQHAPHVEEQALDGGGQASGWVGQTQAPVPGSSADRQELRQDFAPLGPTGLDSHPAPRLDLAEGLPGPSEATEASSEGFSESTEDVVDLAMRAVDNRSESLNDPLNRMGRGDDGGGARAGADGEEEGMILVPAVRNLWSQSTPIKPAPVQSTEPAPQPQPQQAAVNEVVTGIEQSAHSRVHSQAIGGNTGSGSGARTAHDLLLQMLNGSSQPAAPSVQASPQPAPQPQQQQQPIGTPLRLAHGHTTSMTPYGTPGNQSYHQGVACPPQQQQHSSYNNSPASQHLHAMPAQPMAQRAGAPVEPHQPALLFGGMGSSTASPATGGAHHRASIWSAGPFEVRNVGSGAGGVGPGAVSTSTFNPAVGSTSSIWGAPGSGGGASSNVPHAGVGGVGSAATLASPSPNFAAAQAFVYGSFLPPSSSGTPSSSATTTLQQPAPAPGPQAGTHNMNPFASQGSQAHSLAGASFGIGSAGSAGGNGVPSASYASSGAGGGSSGTYNNSGGGDGGPFGSRLPPTSSFHPYPS